MVYPDISQTKDFTVFYDARQKLWFTNFWTSIQHVENCEEYWAIICLKKGYNYIHIS